MTDLRIQPAAAGPTHPGRWMAALVEIGERQRLAEALAGTDLPAVTTVCRSDSRALLLCRETGAGGPEIASDGARGLIFDGFLYNRDELRRLPAWNANDAPSDAELVLRAYRQWGESFLLKIKGLFAIVLLDGGQERLLGARDPMGQMPLFVAEAGRERVFSTSLRDIRQHPGVSSRVNRLALADHLCHRWPDPQETYYEAIRRVRSGHVLTVDRTGGRTARYWHPAPPGESVQWLREADLEQFDSLFDQAVNRCLAQGAAGIYQSGGLDSVSVAAVASDNCRRRELPPLRAYSLIFPDPDCNEEVVQRGVASQLGMPLCILPFEEAAGPQGPLFAALELVRTWNAPLFNLWLPSYMTLGHEARGEGCRVILTGNGGDEWLTVTPLLAADLIRRGDVAGLYRLWDSMQRSYRFSRLTMARSLLWRFGLRTLMGGFAARFLLRVAPERYRQRKQRLRDAQTPPWVAPNPQLRREMDARAERSQPEPLTGGFYFREMHTALEHPLVMLEMEEIFETGRRLGVRYMQPFWDADLVEFMYRTPPELLNRGGRSKGLVRQMLTRRFPDLGFERHRKVSGTSYYETMMQREVERAWQAMGRPTMLEDAGLLDSNAIAPTLNEVLNGRQLKQTHRLWDVLNLETWVRGAQ